MRNAARIVLPLMVFSLIVATPAAAAPANDNFPGTTITSIPYSDAFDLATATIQTGERTRSCSSTPARRTIWYSYTAAVAEKVAARINAGGPSEFLLSAYTGSKITNLTEIGCQRSVSLYSQMATLVIDMAPHTTYYFQVDLDWSSATPIGTFELFRADVPPNDAFSGATEVSGLPLRHEAGDNSGATTEAGEPMPSCLGQAGPTLWFRWTAPGSGKVVFDLIGGHGYSAVAVYRGSDLAGLTRVACAAYLNAAPADVVAGETYLIQATGAPGRFGEVVLNINPPVPGDDLAAPVTAGVGLNSAQVLRSTAQVGEPSNCYSGGTVWFKFTGGSSVLKTTVQPGRYALLAIFDSSMTRLACLSTWYPTHYFEARPDETYYFQLSSPPYYNNESSANAAFSLEVVPPPPNDDVTDAQEISGSPSEATGNNLGARLAGEPVPSCAQKAGATVWFKWTAPSSAKYVVDTFDSNFDTTLAIYTGEAPGPLTQVACNDDHNTPQSRVVLDAEEGKLYWLQVGGYREARGNVGVDIGPEPLNDNLAEAEEVVGPIFMDTTSNVRATNEPNEPRPSCNPDETIKTVWYRFTPTKPGAVVADTTGSTFDAVLAVYTGANMQSFRELACSDLQEKGTPSAVTFAAVPGETYYIQVGGWKARYDTGAPNASGALVLRVIPPVELF